MGFLRGLFGKVNKTLYGEWTAENREYIEKNLQTLAALRRGKEVDESRMRESESILLEDIPGLEAEEVPIIDVGGIEPVIMINEEEDELDLSSEIEDIELPPEYEEHRIIEERREVTSQKEPTGIFPQPTPPVKEPVLQQAGLFHFAF